MPDPFYGVRCRVDEFERLTSSLLRAKLPPVLTIPLYVNDDEVEAYAYLEELREAVGKAGADSIVVPLILLVRRPAESRPAWEFPRRWIDYTPDLDLEEIEAERSPRPEVQREKAPEASIKPAPAIPAPTSTTDDPPSRPSLLERWRRFVGSEAPSAPVEADCHLTEPVSCHLKPESAPNSATPQGRPLSTGDSDAIERARARWMERDPEAFQDATAFAAGALGAPDTLREPDGDAPGVVGGGGERIPAPAPIAPTLRVGGRARVQAEPVAGFASPLGSSPVAPPEKPDAR